MVIDRPLGSVHPRHPDICYPVNYGFLPGTISGDGAPIDAYVLGVDTPVETYQGVVIAVVAREDDVEDKLVVAPLGTTFSRDEIAQAVAFQEQFFRSYDRHGSLVCGDTSCLNPPTIDREEIEIIIATPEDWQAAREIRLESLLRDPQAFGATYAEAVDRTEAEWRAWVSRPGADHARWRGLRRVLSALWVRCAVLTLTMTRSR